MTSVTHHNFGLLIAYLIPGFISISAIRDLSPQINAWLAAKPGVEAPTLAGFLFITLASIFAGLLASTLRWLFVDHFLALCGVRRPAWNLSKLGQSLSAFTTLIEIHYRYYQFYGNSFIAICFYLAVTWAQGQGTFAQYIVGPALLLLLLVGARDTLSKYYRRVEECLQTLRHQIFHVDLEREGKSFDVFEGNIATAPFDATDIGAVQACSSCELLLRNAFSGANGS